MSRGWSRELIRVIILSLIVMLLLPVSIVRWQKQNESSEDILIRLRMPDGSIEKMYLEEYIVGVVAAEMPAQFVAEALKAQAVAARTYAAKRIQQDSQINAGYDVDTTVQTQAWISNVQMRDKWGVLGYWRYRNKIQNAVESTKGLVLIANGNYIDAVYHSSSGRKNTERSEDVWNASRGYLLNVSSCEEDPGRFVKKVTFSVQELSTKLNLSTSQKELTANDFNIIGRTAAGRVKTVAVLGRIYSGIQIRSALGLASTDWELTVLPESVTFTTYGNGHAVGMSQYGANDLAQKGLKHQDILNHYYPGSKIMALGKQ